MTLDLQVSDVMIARRDEKFGKENKIESLVMSKGSANAVVPSKRSTKAIQREKDLEVFNY